ncbi:MAG: protein kinase [Leptolyngbya sp. SIO1D8]|nr:protein kinase [Leptolyngbya sp. SIO1D8]
MELNFLRSLRPGSGQPLGGRYKIIRQLGAGGFGQTFHAQDLHLPGQPVCVIKQLKPQVNSAQGLQVARRLFDTEAQVLYELGSHPQIPRLLAHFEDGKEFYLAQELIVGHSLTEEFLPETPWAEAKVVSFLGDVLSTLAFVHGHRVIHRDLKPSNLIRRTKDNRVVLIDFGAVKQARTQFIPSDPGISHTISIGTQGYMPNEQQAGRPQFSSDVYAVGMMGIQALTGRLPRHLPLDPHSNELAWHAYAPRVNPTLAAVLDYMVRYDYRDRYGTAAEALSALQSLPPVLSELLPTGSSNRHSTTGLQQTGGAQQTGGIQQTQPPAANASSPIPAQPTEPPPAIASKTVPVLGRYPRTSSMSVKGSRSVGSVETDVLPPQKSSHKALISVGILISVVLGMGLLTWRAFAPPANVTETTPEPTAPTSEDSPSPTAEVPVPTPADGDILDSEPLTELSPDPSPEESLALESEPESLSAPAPETDLVPSSEEAAVIEASAGSDALTEEEAQATVAAFYDHVSNQSWEAARSLVGGALAQQFDPNFFQQFQQVSVDNLRITDQGPGRIEILGRNIYVYEDGSSQQEERTYTVQVIDGQPRIVASAFVRVLQIR